MSANKTVLNGKYFEKPMLIERNRISLCYIALADWAVQND